jgi:hypothetical protein
MGCVIKEHQRQADLGYTFMIATSFLDHKSATNLRDIQSMSNEANRQRLGFFCEKGVVETKRKGWKGYAAGLAPHMRQGVRNANEVELYNDYLPLSRL